jgi:acyl carrier protein
MNFIQLQEGLIGELTTVLGHDVGLDDELLADGGLDSFSILQMVAYLEDSYGFLIPNENLATVNFRSARIISDWVLPLCEVQ